MSGWAVLSQLLSLVELLIFARAILSWFVSPSSRNPIVLFIRGVTEPILAPIRSILPRTGGMDFSPMVAILIIYVIQSFLH